MFAREHQERGNQAYTLRLLGDIATRCKPSESEPAVALLMAMTFWLPQAEAVLAQVG